MKNTAMPLIASIALAATAQAGETYSAKGGKEVVPPPPSCLWTWFAGGSVGTIQNDWDEEIYTLHVGVERTCPGEKCTNAFYLEVGFTEKDETLGVSSVPGGPPSLFYDLDVEIIPITLNYKYECALSDKFNWYVGAGAGIALVDLDGSGGGTNLNGDDDVFYAHIFAGVVYNVSQNFEIFGGARYIFMDDPDLTGVAMFDDEVELDGEIHYEIGGRINF